MVTEYIDVTGFDVDTSENYEQYKIWGTSNDYALTYNQTTRFYIQKPDLLSKFIDATGISDFILDSNGIEFDPAISQTPPYFFYHDRGTYWDFNYYPSPGSLTHILIIRDSTTGKYKLRVKCDPTFNYVLASDEYLEIYRFWYNPNWDVSWQVYSYVSGTSPFHFGDGSVLDLRKFMFADRQFNIVTTSKNIDASVLGNGSLFKLGRTTGGVYADDSGVYLNPPGSVGSPSSTTTTDISTYNVGTIDPTKPKRYVTLDTDYTLTGLKQYGTPNKILVSILDNNWTPNVIFDSTEYSNKDLIPSDLITKSYSIADGLYNNIYYIPSPGVGTSTFGWYAKFTELINFKRFILNYDTDLNLDIMIGENIPTGGENMKMTIQIRQLSGDSQLPNSNIIVDLPEGLCVGNVVKFLFTNPIGNAGAVYTFNGVGYPTYDAAVAAATAFISGSGIVIYDALTQVAIQGQIATITTNNSQNIPQGVKLRATEALGLPFLSSSGYFSVNTSTLPSWMTVIDRCPIKTFEIYSAESTTAKITFPSAILGDVPLSIELKASATNCDGLDFIHNGNKIIPPSYLTNGRRIATGISTTMSYNGYGTFEVSSNKKYRWLRIKEIQFNGIIVYNKVGTFMYDPAVWMNTIKASSSSGEQTPISYLYNYRNSNSDSWTLALPGTYAKQFIGVFIFSENKSITSIKIRYNPTAHYSTTGKYYTNGATGIKEYLSTSFTNNPILTGFYITNQINKGIIEYTIDYYQNGIFKHLPVLPNTALSIPFDRNTNIDVSAEFHLYETDGVATFNKLRLTYQDSYGSYIKHCPLSENANNLSDIQVIGYSDSSPSDLGAYLYDYVGDIISTVAGYSTSALSKIESNVTLNINASYFNELVFKLKKYNINSNVSSLSAVSLSYDELAFDTRKIRMYSDNKKVIINTQRDDITDDYVAYTTYYDVSGICNFPPAAGYPNEKWIVGTSPSDYWVGHANEIVIKNPDPTIIEIPDISPSVGQYCSVSYDMGKYYVSYYDSASANLKYAYHNGSIWTITTLDSAGDVGKYSKIKGFSGYPVILYYDETNGNLKEVRYDIHGNWNISIIDSTDNVGQGISLYSGGGSNLFVSYYNATAERLKYAFYDGSWHIETVPDTDSVGKYSSVVFKNYEGSYPSIVYNPAIAYYDKTTTSLKYAYKSGGSWYIETIDAIGDVGKYCSMSGANAISYYDATNGNLKFAWNDGINWYTEIIDSDGDVGQYISMWDNNTHFHVSYYDVTNARLKHAWKDVISMGAWSIEVVDSIGNVGQYSYGTIDGSVSYPFPHAITYYDATNNSLKLASTSTNYGNWAIQTVDSGVLRGYFTKIQVDLSDLPKILYYDKTHNYLKYASRGVSSWTLSNIDINVGSYPDDASVSLALDSIEIPHVSYYDVINANLRYATYSGGIWTTSIIDSIGEVGLFSSIVCDAYNNSYVSYYDTTNGALKFASFSGVSWNKSQIDSGNVGKYNSLAIDSANRFHISYYDEINTTLKHAYTIGNSWTVETVDSTPNVGKYTSVAIDSANVVHIAYYDVGNSNLKYAVNTNGIWKNYTIDTGNVGKFTSIKINSSTNTPVISYYDATNKKLKYAVLTNNTWVLNSVDSTFYLGEYSSIALDSSNIMHASSLDSSNTSLKYLKIKGNAWLYHTPINRELVNLSTLSRRYCYLNGTWVKNESLVDVMGKYRVKIPTSFLSGMAGGSISDYLYIQAIHVITYPDKQLIYNKFRVKAILDDGTERTLKAKTLYSYL